MFRYLFKKKHKFESSIHAEPCIPNPGERWQIRGKNDPWEGKRYNPVKILDVKDGWVRYYLGDVFPDERQKIEKFVRIYTKVS